MWPTVTSGQLTWVANFTDSTVLYMLYNWARPYCHRAGEWSLLIAVFNHTFFSLKYTLQ